MNHDPDFDALLRSYLRRGRARTSPQGGAALASLRTVADSATVAYWAGVRRKLEPTLTELHARPINVGGPVLLCMRFGDQYFQVPHLIAGEHGAIACAMTCFRPRVDDAPGERGWIGTGSNRFRVRDVISVAGIVFHIGEVISGGFHETKVSYKLAPDPS